MLQNIENVDTPFLWVDLDRMEENIAVFLPISEIEN